MPDKSETLLNNLIFFFFLLFLFSSTFSIAMSQICLGVSLLAFLFLVASGKHNPLSKELRPVYYAIAMYIVWMIITSLAGDTPLRSLIMLKEEWLFCIIPVGIHLFRQRHYRHILMITLAVGVVLVSIYGVIQHYTGVNLFKDYSPVQAPDGTFYAPGGFHHNLTYGNYLAVASMFLLSYAIIKAGQIFKMPHLVILIGGVMGVVGTVMSYSRTAVATLPIVMVVLTWLKGRRWAIFSTIAIIVLSASALLFVVELARKYELAFKRDLAGEHDSSRLFIWKKTLVIVTENPFLGIGQGNFANTYTKYLNPEMNETKSRPHAHNDILNYAAIAGIPGALIFFLIWFMVYYKLHRIWHNSNPDSDKKIFAGAAAIGGLAFFLTSLTEATFADEEIRQLLMAVWAAGLWPLYSVNSNDFPERAESA